MYARALVKITASDTAQNQSSTARHALRREKPQSVNGCTNGGIMTTFLIGVGLGAVLPIALAEVIHLVSERLFWGRW